MCLQMGFKNVKCWGDPNMKRQTVPKFGHSNRKGPSLFLGTTTSNLLADLRVGLRGMTELTRHS